MAVDLAQLIAQAKQTTPAGAQVDLMAIIAGVTGEELPPVDAEAHGPDLSSLELKKLKSLGQQQLQDLAVLELGVRKGRALTRDDLTALWLGVLDRQILVFDEYRRLRDLHGERAMWSWFTIPGVSLGFYPEVATKMREISVRLLPVDEVPFWDQMAIVRFLSRVLPISQPASDSQVREATAHAFGIFCGGTLGRTSTGVPLSYEAKGGTPVISIDYGFGPREHTRHEYKGAELIGVVRLLFGIR